MPIDRKKLLLILPFLVFIQGAVHAQKNNTKGNLACKMRMAGIELQWISVPDIKSLKLPAKIGSARLPKSYSVFSTNASILKKYMMALKSKGGSIVLPAAGKMACASFAVTNSGTMSAELAAKFPELVSLKGVAEDNSATARIDYDGVQLNAEMYIGGIPYIVAPWKKGKVIYYLLYKKEDSGVERKPFSE